VREAARVELRGPAFRSFKKKSGMSTPRQVHAGALSEVQAGELLHAFVPLALCDDERLSRVVEG